MNEVEHSGLGFWTKALIGVLAACMLAFTVAFLALQYYIRHDPENQFTRENIMSILAKESGVYYADGKTKIGTFFEDFHRDYQPIDSIPKLLQEAVISAEDKNFYRHGGIDFMALLVAIGDDLRSFSLKRGGSTITQQTAKNLFFMGGFTKWDRLKAKIPELVHALKLEKKFSKEEILEFYLNQFYVAGNGKGVAIAARYFFDKNMRELDLAEIAFIAGCVKGPNQYNPFIARTEENRKQALLRSHNRTIYVLHRMYQDGKITEEEYKDAKQKRLSFKMGSFRFELSTNLVEIQRLMESEPIQEKLHEFGIDDYVTAGVQIYTTLDEKLQGAAEFHLNKNLSEFDVIFRGYQKIAKPRYRSPSHLRPGSFAYGKICSTRVDDKGLISALQVQFGLEKAWISEKNLAAFNQLWYLHESGLRRDPPADTHKKFYADNFPIGGHVFCGVPLDYHVKENNEIFLAQYPVLQGGLRLLRQGKILANVGGFGNVGYDRVNQAKRQFGSTYKPMVYAAALQLGWRPLDTLINQRQLFKIGDVFYFPRPAHPAPEKVSIMWAGRKSENIASVYLLYHLFDKLKFSEFWNVCSQLGMSPGNFPNHTAFGEFVRDSLGFILNDARRKQLHYLRLRHDLSLDLVFEDRGGEAASLKELPFGDGYAEERRKYRHRRTKEDALRYGILRHNYLDYVNGATLWLRQSGGTLYTNRHNQYAAFTGAPEPGWIRSTALRDTLDPALILWEGLVSLETLFKLKERLAGENPVSTKYLPEDLFYSNEFRAQVALHYMVHYSKQLGVTGPMDAVMSFPLGSNVVTLEDATNVYQTLHTGRVFHSEKTEQPQLLIQKITLANGTEIYRDTLASKTILEENLLRHSQSILRSVVEGGTGSQIAGELHVVLPKNSRRLKVPAGGKTGTTNDYRNGAFIGYVAGPLPATSEFSADAGYTLGIYVGFDDNTTMKRRGLIGYGGTVSLPVWIPMAQSLVEEHKFSGKVDPLDLNLQLSSQLPLAEQDAFQQVKVYQHNGLRPGPHDNLDSNTTFVWIAK